MSKLTKNELKDIVKACLVEILEEGLIKSSSLVESKNHVSTRPKVKSRNKINSAKRSYLDKIEYSANNSEQPKNIKTNLTENSIINQMLADTAKSTLHEQMAADRKKNFNAVGGDQASLKVANSKLDDLFGGATEKWSKLAFFDKN